MQGLSGSTTFEVRQAMRCSTVILLSILCTGLLFAQADRATITGTVSDATGAVMPNVRIVATSVDTGATFHGSTNETGIYTIPALPIGTYEIEMSQSGFKGYKQTGISLMAAQILSLNVRMTVGPDVETVSIVGAPLLEVETSGVSMTMEESAIRELPLNAQGGRDALNLLIATAPTARSINPQWIQLAGGESMSNATFVDGVEGTAGKQGYVPTPGLDALQEMQLASTSTDAELGGTSGASILYELKSGTNKFHGSAFEFLQNTDLNANTWANNYFLSQCAPSDRGCRKQYSRPMYRFNDYGGSAGGPVWKNRTFVFGDYEYFSENDRTLNPVGQTVPTPQMLTGDFSQLLTGGSHQGTITDANGNPMMNPCTGLAYQYGQIFDPATEQVVSGQTCATPFPGNIIPSNRLSSQSQKVAAIYSKYYTPTITNRIYNNFPSMLSGNPEIWKRNIDIKLDHYFSERHHLSTSYDYLKYHFLYLNGGFPYSLGSGPFSSYFATDQPNHMYRVVDNYSFTPRLVNTFSIGFSRQPTIEFPQHTVKASDYGFNVNSSVFPVLNYGPSSNGIQYPSVSTAVADYYTYNAWHIQNSVSWLRGRHNFKFGGTFVAQGMNDGFGGNVQTYNFTSDTGGPIDPRLTSSGPNSAALVGSGFANMMLGNVQSANEQINQTSYPRQKSFALFAVDDFKVTPKLTLNLGLRWDVTLPGHEAAGRWTNFDLNAQNPTWAPSKGAWVFAKNSGTTFEKNMDWGQFGPHIGVAYQMTKKLVARGSYGLFYVPLSALSSGYGPAFPANQTALNFGNSQVINTVEGTTAFNWNGGYPGVVVNSPHDNTATGFGIWNYPMYIHPDFLDLGHTHNFYVGAQYEIAKNLLLDARYMGNKGGNLHDYGRTVYKNYPTFSAYQPVLLSGHIFDQITSPATAASAGVPYPYPGFNGPAWAAMAPFPQLSSAGAQVLTFGDPATNDVSAFNAFIVEVKARNSHGLYVDYSYTLSKITGNQIGMNNFANNWWYPAQNVYDIQHASYWVQPYDQRHLAKGYILYDLPFGRNRQWLRGSRLLDTFVGGWTIGFYGSYGSGVPMGWVLSSYQLPHFFCCQRANFANGATASNIGNHFRGNLNLSNLNAASNNDFNPNLFAPTTAAAPFGNTPYAYNDWRWNPGVANESMSFIKHFSFGEDGRFSASLRGEFFNVFNRHYFDAPDQSPWSPTFGQVTGVHGNRVGQVAARFEW